MGSEIGVLFLPQPRKEKRAERPHSLLRCFLQTSGGSAPAQVVHTQPRAVGSPATASSDLVSLAPTQSVRAVTSVTASAVVTTSLTPVQTPTRSLVTQVSQGKGRFDFLREPSHR